ncbi:MAG: Fic family protein [Bacteroidia bacterium]|nr:Fic family protein [Bacteroidia bacterium]
MKRKNLTDFIGGKLVQKLEYKCFEPELICNQWILNEPELTQLLSEADRHLGKLDAFADLIPDVDFFIKMHITKEATVSSKIEGTQTTLEEAFVKEDNLTPERRNDWVEVHNYINALNYAIEEMKKLPISNRLIKQTHKILLQGVRGKDKMPGEYRTSQNWIGATLKDAFFIPPDHKSIGALMQDLENFIHSEILATPIQVPHLVKIAMIHYQFETIHPFLDGNGRIGRLLITLYLIDKKLLKMPTLYLSDFFERNRKHYYDNLTVVRTKNDMEQWIRFFLVGVIETAKKGISTFEQIIKLRNDIELNRLIKLGRKQIAAKNLINELYKQPIMEGTQIAEVMKVNPSTANRMINDFVGLNILREVTGYKRNRVYAFHEYINLF